MARFPYLPIFVEGEAEGRADASAIIIPKRFLPKDTTLGVSYHPVRDIGVALLLPATNGESDVEWILGRRDGNILAVPIIIK